MHGFSHPQLPNGYPTQPLTLPATAAPSTPDPDPCPCTHLYAQDESIPASLGEAKGLGCPKSSLLPSLFSTCSTGEGGSLRKVGGSYIWAKHHAFGYNVELLSSYGPLRGLHASPALCECYAGNQDRTCNHASCSCWRGMTWAQVFLWVRSTAHGCGSAYSEVMSVKDYRHCPDASLPFQCQSGGTERSAAH